ncbi:MULTISPECIES: transcriptional repressor [unclassified Halomonas]|uniref:transcriptional repressor n=1 Tax=unclassified Halomonas TaxID=2609666 RepID=UPI0021E51473|nr:MULTISPECIES: transcriptional repressor [unclassified Halomonas]UYG01678.1 transcriptional repressor [Halomonas sp. GD1P12]WNL40610.1 transcriptional repressor [Halomonas sp. PAMB 3232]WNL43934.1 transcriptional repressor [Halomonas sp. PAMB 3264]
MMKTNTLLQQAESQCINRGVRFTPIRKRVLEMIADSGGGLKAYDLLDQLSSEHAAARPPTVYRALEFLITEGFVHRIESQNAYIACACPEHTHGFQLLICRLCGHVEELHLDAISDELVGLAREKGFNVERQTIELQGYCATCRESGQANAAAD